jgi:hypothetical protein
VAIFKIEIFKSHAGENWGNVYHVNATDLTAAQAAAPILGAMEVSFHQVGILVQYARVSDIVPNTDNFVTVPINDIGDSTGTGHILPLFDTLRLDLSVGAGRPGRKYYRGVLTTDNITDDIGTVDPDASGPVVTAFNNAIADCTAADATLVQPDGDVLTEASAFPTVQMRQLHRKRRPASP